MLFEVSLGLRMAGFGLILGGGYWLLTRYGRRPTDAYGRGRYRGARAAAVPLIGVGILGLFLWALGH
jgi:hypothetical protein